MLQDCTQLIAVGLTVLSVEFILAVVIVMPPAATLLQQDQAFATIIV